MKRMNLQICAVLLVLIALLSACSGPTENSGPSNAGAPQAQANSNSSAQPQSVQDAPPAAAPSPAPPTVQQIPPAPLAKSTAAGNTNAANAANPSAAGAAREPKLVAPDKQIDFGKQPQNKSLVRAIAIKNGGRADLNIESATPS